jgi:type 1 glutamine amidotransferase
MLSAHATAGARLHETQRGVLRYPQRIFKWTALTASRLPGREEALVKAVTVSWIACVAVLSAIALPAAQQSPQPQPPTPTPPPSSQAAPAAPAAPAAQARPLRVFIQAGLKTHAEGQHDYPQFLADWSKLLTNRGAIVDGSLHFPSARELAGIDVLVIYKGDAGYLSEEDRTTLDSFLRRGGGLVSLHDALCGPEPEYFSRILGGAKKHGEVNYTLEADVEYTIAAPSHPIVQGMTGFTIKDEAFFLITWAKSPEINVLATAPIAATRSAGTHKGEVVPQIWTYERALFPGPGSEPYRAFVWMQGHNYANFAHAQVQPMLLRAIAWAGKRPADALMTERPRPAPGGTRDARTR